MAEQNQQSLHLEHRTWSSRFKKEVFPVGWVGKNPSIDERRQYMAAYLAWMIPCVGQKPGDYELELRQSAQRQVVAKYVADGMTSMRDGTFEYLVDRAYWTLWCKFISHLTWAFQV